MSPSTVCSPQLKSTCHYIVNRYVKTWHLRLRDANNMHQEIWVSATANRSKYGYWPDRADENCHCPDGRNDPNFSQIIMLVCTAPPFPKPTSVWPMLVLGCGIRHCLGAQTEKIQNLLHGRLLQVGGELLHLKFLQKKTI